MKKLLLALALFIPLFAPTPAAAKVMMQEKGTVTINKSEVIDDDLFVGSENVVIDGTIKGSVFAGAGSVTIAGSVAGDIIVGTGNLTLTGAQIGGNLIVGAGQINIDDKSKIGDSLIVGTGSISSSAPVGRNAMIGAGTAYLNNTIGKELRFGGRSLELGSKVKIAGDMTYALQDENATLKQADGATISGNVSRYTSPVKVKEDVEKAKVDARKAGKVLGGGFRLFSFIGSLIIGLLLLKLFPKSMESISKKIQSTLGKSIGIGFLTAILVVPVLLVLVLTIIGIPVVGMLIPIMVIDFHLAKLVSALALGEVISKQFSWDKISLYAKYIIGLTVFYLGRSLPVAGWIVSMLFTWAGLGAIWLYVRSHAKNL